MNQDIEKSKTEHVQNNLPYKQCLSCGAELLGIYCYVCGQS